MRTVGRGLRALSLLLACCIGWVSATSASPDSDWTQHESALVFLRGTSGQVAAEFMARLRGFGAHASIVYWPDAAVLRASQGALLRLREAGLISTVVGDHPSVAEEAPDPQRKYMELWKRSLALEASRRERVESGIESGTAISGRAMPPEHCGMTRPREATLTPPRMLKGELDHLPYGAGYFDTSEFLMGSVSVGVWLLESVGSDYDWTELERITTLAGIQLALDQWVVHGGAAANLTFFVETHDSVPVSDDPIKYPQVRDTIWVGEALESAGFDGSTGFDQCYAYNNDLRRRNQTDWAYSIFVVDSDDSVNLGRFSNGGYAWAWIGGPWVFMSRHSTWAFNADSYYWAVPMHETGHIFYATDEYDGAGQRSGYLNAQDTVDASVVCLMNRNVEEALCVPTQRQLGWRDVDGDLVFDILDTRPQALLDAYVPDPTFDSELSYRGRATVQPMVNSNPRGYGHDITLNEVEAVEYRVDGGPWIAGNAGVDIAALALDGNFDTGDESFAFTTAPLSSGPREIAARAVNNLGATDSIPAIDAVELMGSVVGVRDPVRGFEADPAPGSMRSLRLKSHPSPFNPATTISFDLPRSAYARLSIYDLAGRVVKVLFDEPLSAGEHAIEWRGRDGVGREVASGAYFVQLRAGATRATTRVVLVR